MIGWALLSPANLQQLIVENTPIFAAAALAVVILAAWRLPPALFRSISWQAVGGAAALLWGLLAAVLIVTTWDFYYSLFVPAWYRVAAPLGAILLYSLLGAGIRWLALRLPGNPAVNFCLLGGLEALPEHAIGIYRFDILEIPLLQGTSAATIFVFAYFEYVVYWGITLFLALGVERLLRVIRAGPGSGRRTGETLSD